MKRVSLKIVGSSGQGIDSVGEIVAKALKRSGYCVFGYREYPSLIKGGHASYQLDVSDEAIESTETHVNIVVTFNHHGLEINVPDLPRGMNARIRAPGANDGRGLADEAPQRCLKRLLHGLAVGLSLPADKGRAVVFDDELVTGHGSF